MVPIKSPVMKSASVKTAGKAVLSLKSSSPGLLPLSSAVFGTNRQCSVAVPTREATPEHVCKVLWLWWIKVFIWLGNSINIVSLERRVGFLKWMPPDHSHHHVICDSCIFLHVNYHVNCCVMFMFIRHLLVLHHHGVTKLFFFFVNRIEINIL